jgi:hypothetical protein
MAAFVVALAATFVIMRERAAPERVLLVLETYFRDLKTVSALVGGEPARLLVDTGGGATLVTPDFAARLGCKPQGVDIGRRMNGDAVSFQRCPAQLLQAGSFRTSISPLAVFDVNALLPGELPRLDGVMALDAFTGRVVRIDWAAGRIEVAPETADPPLAVRWATGDSGRFLSALARVDGPPGGLWFLLDSGNLAGTLVSEDVLAEGLLHPKEGVLHLAIGGRPTRAFTYPAARLVIDGALGTDFLLSGPLTLDLRYVASLRHEEGIRATVPRSY